MNALADRLRDWPEHLAERAREFHVPGASLAVLVDDEVFATACGVLNARTGVETTCDSVFQMGSITKVWTTTLVMQLVDEGKLDLDARVIEMLPAFGLADADAARAITLRQLLTHTSGIDGDQFVDTGRGDDAIERFVAYLHDVGCVHQPGARFSYCNAGFVVAGRLVEVLRGASYDAVLRERILQPLGLRATGTLPEQAILHRAAAGHFMAPDGAPHVVPVWSLHHSNAPAGATPFTTASELLAFANLHLHDGVVPASRVASDQRAARSIRLASRVASDQRAARSIRLASRVASDQRAARSIRLASRVASDQRAARPHQDVLVLSPESARSMQTRHFELHGSAGSMADAWGLGWMLKDGDGGTLVCHNGVTIGQRAWLDVLPDRRVALALLTNGGDANALASRVRSALLREVGDFGLPPLPAIDGASPVEPDRFLGVYDRAGARIEVAPCGTGIGVRIRAIWHSMAPDPPLLPLRPVGGDRFRVTLPNAADDVLVGFADAGAAGGARFVEMQGRAHPRVA
jgi:CubicO group peptidase (beta-lactamase class C family)